MADFDSEHLLLTLHGWLGAPGLEEWSFGIRGEWGGPYDAVTLQTAVDAMATPCATYFQSSSTIVSGLTHLKLAHILPNGHYPPNSSAYEHTYTPPLGGANNSMGLPFQASLAVSLMTAFSRGNAHAGRFYLPAPKYGILDDGRISAANALAQANLTKTWLNALLGLAFFPCVFSRGGVVDPVPVHHEITGLRVGRVVDTIRSRRRNLQEDYQAVVL